MRLIQVISLPAVLGSAFLAALRPQVVVEYREDLRLGKVDGTGPDVLGRVAAIEVDATGRIYVLDAPNARVVVFDSTGAVIRTIGRKGQGPGELEFPTRMTWARPNELVVIHAPGYAVFDTTGRFLRSVPRPSMAIQPPQIGSVANGAMCDMVNVRTDTTVVFAMIGDSVVSRLALARSPRAEVSFGPGRTIAAPFSTTASYTIDCERRVVWKMDPTDSVVRVLGLRGDTVRRIAHGFARSTISASDRDAAIRQIAQETGASITDLDRVTPRVGRYFSDAFVSREGDLWIAPSQPIDPRGRLYRILAPDGRVTSARLIPLYPAVRPVVVGRAVYGVVTDRDGVHYVVRRRRG